MKLAMNASGVGTDELVILFVVVVGVRCSWTSVGLFVVLSSVARGLATLLVGIGVLLLTWTTLWVVLLLLLCV